MCSELECLESLTAVEQEAWLRKETMETLWIALMTLVERKDASLLDREAAFKQAVDVLKAATPQIDPEVQEFYASATAQHAFERLIVRHGFFPPCEQTRLVSSRGDQRDPEKEFAVQQLFDHLNRNE